MKKMALALCAAMAVLFTSCGNLSDVRNDPRSSGEPLATCSETLELSSCSRDLVGYGCFISCTRSTSNEETAIYRWDYSACIPEGTTCTPSGELPVCNPSSLGTVETGECL